MFQMIATLDYTAGVRELAGALLRHGTNPDHWIPYETHEVPDTTVPEWKTGVLNAPPLILTAYHGSWVFARQLLASAADTTWNYTAYTSDGDVTSLQGHLVAMLYSHMQGLRPAQAMTRFPSVTLSLLLLATDNIKTGGRASWREKGMALITIPALDPMDQRAKAYMQALYAAFRLNEHDLANAVVGRETSEMSPGAVTELRQKAEYLRRMALAMPRQYAASAYTKRVERTARVLREAADKAFLHERLFLHLEVVRARARTDLEEELEELKGLRLRAQQEVDNRLQGIEGPDGWRQNVEAFYKAGYA
jgi:hypothetical protein